MHFPLSASAWPSPRLIAWLVLAGLAMAGHGTAHAAGDDRLPYWASLRANEVNMRAGPGEDYRIAWVYHRQHLPVKVLREMESWRLIQDQDGTRGWVMLHFISRERSGVIIGTAPAAMRASPDDGAALAWRLAPGVIGRLGDCGSGWCKLNVDGRVGYVRQTAIWGSGDP